MFFSLMIYFVKLVVMGAGGVAAFGGSCEGDNGSNVVALVVFWTTPMRSVTPKG